MKIEDFDIKKYLDLSGYDNDIRKNRRKGNDGSNEFFTPYPIVKYMSERISEDDWKDPNKTFMDPTAGNGQFILYIIYNRLKHGIKWQTALETTYGVELMQDNVDECKDRVINLLNALDIAFSEKTAREIMDYNFVCHDFFTWNFEEWRPYTEEELKKINKKK